MDNDFKLPGQQSPSVQPPLNDNPETQKQTTIKPAAFRTPEAVAAEQTLQAAPETTASVTDNIPPASKSGSDWRQKLALHWPPGRKEWLVAVGVVLLIVVSISGWLLTRPDKKPVAVHHVVKPVAKPVAPKIVPSTLTGLPVDPTVNQRPVTGVMIENSLDARPQSGLSQAGVVFEAIAEGGITRFLTLFQDTVPTDVGPIRSARPYYVQWAQGFDAGYAHVGGSPEALDDIKAWGVRDLDQFANGDSYHRISARIAPHNVYTGIDTLQQLEIAKGYTSSTFTGFVRKKEAPLKVPTARTIDIAISGPQFNVHYDYKAATNSYDRSEGGAPHTDANGSTQISPKVVIALVMSYGLEADDHHSQYGTIGSGPAYVYQDGAVTVGQWAKASGKDQFVFTDAAGKPLKLNPGQTWLTAIGSASVTSAP